jgi:adenine-specific DNA-methyltransferase
LKALLPYYAGQVKCIYIDPPYNTKSAVSIHYDDNLEHAQWLAIMYPRLVLLRELMAETGVIFIQIDDKEMAYLRVVCDEIFGRTQFLNCIAVKTSDPSGHKTVNPSPYSQTEYLLMYAKDKKRYAYKQRYVESGYDTGYNQVILNFDAPYTEWETKNINEVVAESLGHENTRAARKAMGRATFDALVASYALENREKVFQPTAISDDAGRNIVEVRDTSKENRDTVYRVQREDFDDVYVLNGRQIYFYSSKVRDIDGELVPAKPLTNLWTDIPWNGISGEGGVKFKNGKKPERLLRRCIEISTEIGDLVLDSFLGSGTTSAVAHKMGRRWIGIEMGDHAKTHCVPRLTSVIEGEQSGVSQLVGWQGGGGFRFYQLGPKVFDDQGRINPEIKFEHLAAHIWFAETGTARSTRAMKSPLLGVHNGTAYYLLYNGILGDKTLSGGNMLTMKVLGVCRSMTARW